MSSSKSWPVKELCGRCLSEFIDWRLPISCVHSVMLVFSTQLCGSMSLTNGSGSCYFHHWPSRRQQKTNLTHLHHFSKIKCPKEVTKQEEWRFLLFFLDDRRMIEGSGAGSRSGSITLANGSGSGRPKNMWIQWIRIRIRKTAFSQANLGKMAIRAVL